MISKMIFFKIKVTNIKFLVLVKFYEVAVQQNVPKAPGSSSHPRILLEVNLELSLELRIELKLKFF